MTAPVCGTRAHYQQGCRTLACRAAEASYRAHLRRQQARGELPLGIAVNAKEAGQYLRALLVEAYPRRDVLAHTGLSYPTLRTLNATQRCRLKTLLLMRRAYRILITGEKHLKQLDG